MNTNSNRTPGSDNEEPATNENGNDQVAQEKKPVKSETRGRNSTTSQPGNREMIDPNAELGAVKNPG